MKSAPELRISAIWLRQGPTYIEDLNEAGGVYAVMKELTKLNLLNLDCMTVTGHTVGGKYTECGQ